jgi:methyl-accepting chemotaxis protein
MAERINQKRRLKNLVVNPGQLRMLVPFVALILINFIVVGLMCWSVSSYHSQIGAALTPEQAPVLAKIYESNSEMMVIGWGGAAFVALMSVLLWLLYSHRVSGPILQITRKIDNLHDGHFEEEIHLRERDELKEVADALNRLSKKLGGKSAAS